MACQDTGTCPERERRGYPLPTACDRDGGARGPAALLLLGMPLLPGALGLDRNAGEARRPAPPAPTVVPPPPPGRDYATLAEFWERKAEWVLDVFDVGLPVGESDTVYRGRQEFWSYLHASFASAGVVDSCGAPVPFPGCVTLWRSTDGGRTFRLERPVCLIPCRSCPCDPLRDQINQQQYPRVFFDRGRAFMVYEWGGAVYLRASPDGLRWSPSIRIPGTGWGRDARRCHGKVGDRPRRSSEDRPGDLSLHSHLANHTGPVCAVAEAGRAIPYETAGVRCGS